VSVKDWLDTLQGKITTWGTAFLTAVTVGSLILKWVVADPMAQQNDRLVKLIEEERKARQHGDMVLLSEIQGVRTYDLPSVEDAIDEQGAETTRRVRASNSKTLDAVLRLEKKVDRMAPVPARIPPGQRPR
jgi:hypothetical protein